MAEETVAGTEPQVDPLLQMRNEIRQEFESRFEVWKAKEFAALKDQNDENIQKAVAAYIDKIEQERKPLTPEEIQKLLDQDYLTFTVRLKVEGTSQDFTISELPQTAEKRFYAKFQEKMMAKASTVAALAQQTMDRPFEEKIRAFLEGFGDAFDILAEAVVIVLNYDGKDTTITKEWVQEHLNSWRMWQIVRAQMEVNKLRDFFSQVFQSGVRTQSLMSGVNAQNLPQLLAK